MLGTFFFSSCCSWCFVVFENHTFVILREVRSMSKMNLSDPKINNVKEQKQNKNDEQSIESANKKICTFIKQTYRSWLAPKWRGLCEATARAKKMWIANLYWFALFHYFIQNKCSHTNHMKSVDDANISVALRFHNHVYLQPVFVLLLSVLFFFNFHSSLIHRRVIFVAIFICNFGQTRLVCSTAIWQAIVYPFAWNLCWNILLFHLARTSSFLSWARKICCFIHLEL